MIGKSTQKVILTQKSNGSEDFLATIFSLMFDVITVMLSIYYRCLKCLSPSYMVECSEASELIFEITDKIGGVQKD